MYKPQTSMHIQSNHDLFCLPILFLRVCSVQPLSRPQAHTNLDICPFFHQRILTFFLSLPKNICCGYSLEVPQIVFMKKYLSRYPVIYSKYKRAKMALYRSPAYQTSFESNGLLVKEKFNEIFNQNAFSYFWSTSHLNTYMKFRVNWPCS